LKHHKIPPERVPVPPRPGQDKVAEEIVERVKKGYDVIQLVAAMGAGKTAAVLMAAAELRELGKIVYITHTVSLARQVERQYGCTDEHCVGDPPLRVKALVGMRNFRCPQYGVSADKAECTKWPSRDRAAKYKCYMGPVTAWVPPPQGAYYISLWKTWGGKHAYAFIPPEGEARCPYGQQYVEARDADVLVMTSAMFVRLYVSGLLPKVGLVIFDESQYSFLRLLIDSVEVNVHVLYAQVKPLLKRLANEGNEAALQILRMGPSGAARDPIGFVESVRDLYLRQGLVAEMPEALVELERLRQIAVGRVVAKCVAKGVRGKCPIVAYYVEKYDVSKLIGAASTILVSAPPPFDDEFMRTVGFKSPAVVEWPIPIQRPVEVVLHPRAVPVSSLKRHMIPTYKTLIAQMLVYAAAASGNNAIVLTYSTRALSDGYIPELRGMRSATVDAWAGIDVQQPVDMVLYRAPFPNLGVPGLRRFLRKHPELAEVLALRLLINALRGTRVPGDEAVRLYTADAMVESLLRRAEKYFKSLKFTVAPEDAVVVADCGMGEERIKVFDMDADTLRRIFNSQCKLEVKREQIYKEISDQS